jgi:hypothetical protein
LIDIGVYYYYTQGSKYQTTHSPSFAKLLIENAPKISGKDADKMMACAIGGGLTHLPADLASHGPNGVVQYSITHSFLANSVVHVFAEQHVDNIVVSREPGIKQQETDFLASANECEDLFITSMMGTDAFKDMSEADLRNVYHDFIQEILTSQGSSYDPAFKEKSFIGELDSLPISLLVGYFILMFIFILILILIIIKIIKKQFKWRLIFGIIIFGGLAILMIYFAINMVQGTTFKSFINLIKPISNLVPIGNADTYINNGIDNTRQVLLNGETWLEGKDPSGMGTNPVLINASNQVMWVDYIILGILVLFLIWLAWYVLKRNKVVTKQGFRL